MIVEVTAEGQADLENIADDIVQDNPIRAVGFVQALRARCLELAHVPLVFPLAPRYERYGVQRRAHGDNLLKKLGALLGPLEQASTK